MTYAAHKMNRGQHGFVTTTEAKRRLLRGTCEVEAPLAAETLEKSKRHLKHVGLLFQEFTRQYAAQPKPAQKRAVPAHLPRLGDVSELPPRRKRA